MIIQFARKLSMLTAVNVAGGVLQNPSYRVLVVWQTGWQD
jgi:hypothetical protein